MQFVINNTDLSKCYKKYEAPVQDIIYKDIYLNINKVYNWRFFFQEKITTHIYVASDLIVTNSAIFHKLLYTVRNTLRGRHLLGHIRFKPSPSTYLI